jgi:fructose-1,6-bisphosphatase/inositol monophosphatase family enzyme
MNEYVLCHSAPASAAVWAILKTQRYVLDFIASKPKRALKKQLDSETGKERLEVDNTAENMGEITLKTQFRSFGSEIDVLGEEQLDDDPDIDLTKRKQTMVALLDMIDGTDLLERGLSNWCSALVLYHKGKIECATVGIPDDGIYFAVHNDTNAYWVPITKPPVAQMGEQALPPMPTSDEVRQVKVESEKAATTLSEASICFYGQKWAGLLSPFERLVDKDKKVWKRTNFADTLRALEDENENKKKAEAREAGDKKRVKQGLGLRVYNLAGNPMMVRLATKIPKTESELDVGRNRKPFDAVFDVRGQKPHDVVPGAFIALKAGATMRDLSGQDITEDMLAETLKKPASSRISYILSSTSKLNEELRHALLLSGD